jgi:soluble lytic murein transglycosylase-like protein
MCAVLVAGEARAAEHITLRNGFELDCDHRGVSDAADPGIGSIAAGGGRVRLYLDAGEANYLDVGQDEIVAAETLAPVLPAVAPAPVAAKAELSPAELHELLAAAGAEHDLDVDLLASLVQAESGSHAHAVSRVGAQGLMQLMPATAAQLGVKDSFVPEANVHGGTAYLDSLLKRYHDNLALALAAYNAGPGAVDRYHGVPPYRETRAYVARIIHEFNRRYAARQAAASLAMAR